jgi:hypothetical protein
MMLATCLATVAGLMTSSAAIALLVWPAATSLAISSSRFVSELGGTVTAASAAGFGAADADGVSAMSIAASADKARPRAHSRATMWSPRRRRAGAR